LQVAIFNPLAHYINITIKNVVKVCSSESVNPELLFEGWVKSYCNELTRVIPQVKSE
jgi:hypothetical protein